MGETPFAYAKRRQYYKIVNILESGAKVSQYCVATYECTLYDKLVIYKLISVCLRTLLTCILSQANLIA